MLFSRDEMEYCSEQNSCKEEAGFELGMTHPNGRQHKECQDIELLSSSHFDYLNRMDEATNLFDQKLFTTKDSRTDAINVTSDLKYDCNGFYGDIFTYSKDTTGITTILGPYQTHKMPYALSSPNYTFSIKFLFKGQFPASTQIQTNSDNNNIKIRIKSGAIVNPVDILRQVHMDLSFEGRKFLEDENCFTKKERVKTENELTKCGNRMYPEATIPCQNDPTICLLSRELCDGFPQCPNATDENRDSCPHKFPSNTLECTKVINNGIHMPFPAYKCNGIEECKSQDGADEKDCELGTIITYTVLLPGFGICLTAAIVVVYKTKPHLRDINPEVDASVHYISSPKEKSQKLIEFQNAKNREVHNRKYYNDMLESSNGNQAEALNEVKKNVGPSVTKNILEDIDCSKSFYKKLKAALFGLIKKIPLKIRIVILITKRLFSHFGDIIKDVLVLITLGRLIQGGDFFLAWVSILAKHIENTF